jgi:septal ring factor EnvC (AmiA/AmiB activator)
VGLERERQRMLCDLGERAMALPDFDHPALADYRRQLEELDREASRRGDDIDVHAVQIEEQQREFTAAERELQHAHAEIEAHARELEAKLRPMDVDYRAAVKKARAAEEDARTLARQIDVAKGQLTRLSAGSAATEETVRLKARLDRWAAQREELLAEVPRLEERATQLQPEIERLRQDLERTRAEARENRADLDGKITENKRELRRLNEEIDRLKASVEELVGTRRAIWLECGRQLDIDRPNDERLFEHYERVDGQGARQRRLDLELQVVREPPAPPDTSALTRAGVCLAGGFILLILLIVAIA